MLGGDSLNTGQESLSAKTAKMETVGRRSGRLARSSSSHLAGNGDLSDSDGQKEELMNDSSPNNQSPTTKRPRIDDSMRSLSRRKLKELQELNETSQSLLGSNRLTSKHSPGVDPEQVTSNEVQESRRVLPSRSSRYRASLAEDDIATGLLSDDEEGRSSLKRRNRGNRMSEPLDYHDSSENNHTRTRRSLRSNSPATKSRIISLRLDESDNEDEVERKAGNMSLRRSRRIRFAEDSGSDGDDEDMITNTPRRRNLRKSNRIEDDNQVIYDANSIGEEEDGQNTGGRYNLRRRHREKLMRLADMRRIEQEQEESRHNIRRSTGRITRSMGRDTSESPKRQYTLRPRSERINYQVRIPLYDASPRREQQARRKNLSAQSGSLRDFTARFVSANSAGRTFGEGLGFSFGGGFNSRQTGASGNYLFSGPTLNDSSDDEQNPMKMGGNLSGITANTPIQPLNNFEQNSDLFILNQIMGSKKPSSNMPDAGKKSLTDSDPLAINSDIGFDKVGGLDNHVKSLKEMVLLPLMYPEVFDKFGISPPRGVLFHGPPGTGKTLLARALANSCSTENQKVAFFMRKGADVLSKWVGESERQLKTLFEQARSMAPSIIFFDEIDGLAPVRSAKQDQIHSSVVTTLLALMDGLDSRGQVVVIGATNRIDSVDGALRRPGRFDREFNFPLPERKSRKEILKIHMSKWEGMNDVNEELLDELADCTKGYCGSDLKALCTEAALTALERRYPSIYKSTKKLNISVEDIQIIRDDFAKCLRKIVPASERVKPAFASSLPQSLYPLLGKYLSKARSILEKEFPIEQVLNPEVSNQAHGIGINKVVDAGHVSLRSGSHKLLQSFRPRLLIYSDKPKNGQEQVASALISSLEGVKVNILDLSTIFADISHTPESSLASFFTEIRRQKPSVIYIPSIDTWWMGISEVLRKLFLELLGNIGMYDSILVVATCVVPNEWFQDSTIEDHQPSDFISLLQSFGLFTETMLGSHHSFLKIEAPSTAERSEFFKSVLDEIYISIPGIERNDSTGIYQVYPQQLRESMEAAPESTVSNAEESELISNETDDQKPKRKLTRKELKILHEYDQSNFRRLRIVLREFIHEVIRCKEYKAITKNLNPIEDYGNEIKMDAHDVLEKVEQNDYKTLKPFRKDLAEVLEGFRRLSFVRDELFRLTHINALGDMMEEWIRYMDPTLIEQCKDSAARERRLKPEYEVIYRQQAKERFEYYMSLRSRYTQVEDDEEIPGYRISRRLRGETPTFHGLEDIKKPRRNPRGIEFERTESDAESEREDSDRRSLQNDNTAEQNQATENNILDESAETASFEDNKPDQNAMESTEQTMNEENFENAGESEESAKIDASVPETGDDIQMTEGQDNAVLPQIVEEKPNVIIPEGPIDLIQVKANRKQLERYLNSLAESASASGIEELEQVRLLLLRQVYEWRKAVVIYANEKIDEMIRACSESITQEPNSSQLDCLYYLENVSNLAQ